MSSEQTKDTDFEAGLDDLAREPDAVLSPERPQDAAPAMPHVDVDLSENKDPRAGWPEIIIDEQEGAPNYETVGVNGRTYQIKRGEKTPVPPEVLHVLENAIATRMVPFENDRGKIEHKMVDYPAIPYRVTKFAQGA